MSTSTSCTNVLNNTTVSEMKSTKSASLINADDFHKIDLLISSKKSSALLLANNNNSSQQLKIKTPDLEEAEAAANNKQLMHQVALFKQKNICNKETSPSLLSSSNHMSTSSSSSTILTTQTPNNTSSTTAADNNNNNIR